jgi:predicted nucleic acid-binding protein
LIAYADTGFLISLYREDDHSPAASSLAESKPVFLLTPFIEAEFTNALHLAVFRKRSTIAETRIVYESFAQHQASGVFRAIALSSDVWESAIALSRRHTAKLGVRTLDVLHVATAVVHKPDVFFSFDDRQRKLARATGLKVLPD